MPKSNFIGSSAKENPVICGKPRRLVANGVSTQDCDMRLQAARITELDGSAGFFELGLSLLSVFLLGLLQDSLRSAVDQSLGLSQTRGGDSADGLDDLDLLVANGGEDDVELVLLFLSRSSSARAATATAAGAAASTSNFSSKALTNSESSIRSSHRKLRAAHRWCT